MLSGTELNAQLASARNALLNSIEVEFDKDEIEEDVLLDAIHEYFQIEDNLSRNRVKLARHQGKRSSYVEIRDGMFRSIKLLDGLAKTQLPNEEPPVVS